VARIRIKMNRAGARELLSIRNDELRKNMRERGEAIAAAAGEGVTVCVFQGRDRVRVHVGTESIEAKRAEAEDRTLSAALDAGRG
jgi:hypothetical protein